MKIAITDACIFIDLIELRLTSQFFRLQLEIHTSLDVYNELYPEHRIHWGKFLLSSLAGCALGALTGIAADKLEPPLNPNHRGFFHSYSIWFLAGLAVLEVLSGNKNKIWKNLAVIGFVGYSSHLALDISTPKSLPIIGI